jgi:hypothetical protein
MPKDAGFAAVTALGVNVLELFQHDRFVPLPGERPTGGGTHRATTQDDDVCRPRTHRHHLFSMFGRFSP